MANAVHRLLGPPLKLGPGHPRADGGKTGSAAATAAPGWTWRTHHHRPGKPATVAAQIIWTLARSGRQGSLPVNVDGAPLDDRFVDGWEDHRRRRDRPQGPSTGRRAGVRALIGGSMVALDGQRSPGARVVRVHAPISRPPAVPDGPRCGAVVGPPNAGASLWIGPNGGAVRCHRRPHPVPSVVGARRRGLGGGRRQQRGSVIRERPPASRPASRWTLRP